MVGFYDSDLIFVDLILFQALLNYWEFSGWNYEAKNS